MPRRNGRRRISEQGTSNRIGGFGAASVKVRGCARRCHFVPRALFQGATPQKKTPPLYHVHARKQRPNLIWSFKQHLLDAGVAPDHIIEVEKKCSQSFSSFHYDCNHAQRFRRRGAGRHRCTTGLIFQSTVLVISFNLGLQRASITSAGSGASSPAALYPQYTRP